MSSHRPSIPCPLACFFHATKLCGPEKDLAQKQKDRQIRAWTRLHPITLLSASSGGCWGGGSCQLGWQKHQAAILRCQAQICDLNPRCGGFTVAGACSQRTALMFGPTPASGICTFAVDPSLSQSTFMTRSSHVLLGCSVSVSYFCWRPCVSIATGSYWVTPADAPFPNTLETFHLTYFIYLMSNKGYKHF